MPVTRLVDPQAVIEFLRQRGFRVVRQTRRLVRLRSASVHVDIIVPVYGPLSPTVAGDILTNAGIPQADQDTILRPVLGTCRGARRRAHYLPTSRLDRVAARCCGPCFLAHPIQRPLPSPCPLCHNPPG